MRDLNEHGEHLRELAKERDEARDQHSRARSAVATAVVLVLWLLWLLYLAYQMLAHRVFRLGYARDRVRVLGDAIDAARHQFTVDQAFRARRREEEADAARADGIGFHGRPDAPPAQA